MCQRAVKRRQNRTKEFQQNSDKQFKCQGAVKRRQNRTKEFNRTVTSSSSVKGQVEFQLREGNSAWSLGA
jgi:hypothetical protein